MDFSRRLRELREENNVRQKDLAALLGLKSGAVSKYEQGITQPGIPALVRTAELFRVSVDYLLGLSGVKNPYSPDRFTPREAEIVFKYRKLTKENQIRIDERIGAMIDGLRKA